MSHLPLHQDQLNFMVDLARARLEFLDPFFHFLGYFDSPYFFFVLIPVLWFAVSYQWGIRIFYWFSLNSLINTAVKNLVGWPRPSTDMPSIGLLHPHSYGFPSGGAQTALFLGLILIAYGKTRAAWVAGLIYILLISFSRLYLGVHYPIDILGGWVIALALFFLFVPAKKRLEPWLFKKGPYFSLTLSVAIPLLILFFFPKTSYIMGSVLGVGIGSYFSIRYHLFLPKPKNIGIGIGRSFAAIALLFTLVFLLPGKDTFFHSFVAGLFMSLAASPLCKWLIDRKG